MPSELSELARQTPGYIKGKGNGDVEWVSEELLHESQIPLKERNKIPGSEVQIELRAGGINFLTEDEFKMEELKSGLDHGS